MHNVEIITIGDEILIGQIVDTNSAWMGVELNNAGFNVKQITTVGDDEQQIIKALDLAKNRADIILITGGLGPTKDDITKHTLCKYFNSKLIFDKNVFDYVKQLFAARGREVSETNRKQAEVPHNCIPVLNKKGTAPGMMFEQEGKLFISMPGVPWEMMNMMTEDVIPVLKKNFSSVTIFHKTVLTQGVGESFLADMIEDWENNLPQHMKLAYLPSAGMVKLRLSARSNQHDLEKQVTAEFEKILPLINDYVYGFDNDTIESVVGKLLRDKKQTLATAESCTGGYLSHLITSIPGSSDYFTGSVIAYDNKIKTETLGIDASIIENHGAVSEQAVSAMAENIRIKFNTGYALAISGIAGPSGATPEKPVGTIWIALSSTDKTIAKKFLLGTDRFRNIQVASTTALNMLRKKLLES